MYMWTCLEISNSQEDSRICSSLCMDWSKVQRTFLNISRQNTSVKSSDKSTNEGCLFFQRNLICVFYVDDCRFFAETNEDIDEAVQKLRDAELDRTWRNLWQNFWVSQWKTNTQDLFNSHRKGLLTEYQLCLICYKAVIWISLQRKLGLFLTWKMVMSVQKHGIMFQLWKCWCTYHLISAQILLLQ